VLADFARFEFIDEGGVALPLAEKMLNLNTLDTDRAFCGTVRRDGQVLFVGGFLESSPGVAEVFVIPEKTGIQKHPKVFHKLARRFLEHVLRKDWCDRAETASVNRYQVNRWMTALGFSCEGYTGTEYKKWVRWAQA
jgi:hypothetical protein